MTDQSVVTRLRGWQTSLATCGLCVIVLTLGDFIQALRNPDRTLGGLGYLIALAFVLGFGIRGLRRSGDVKKLTDFMESTIENKRTEKKQTSGE